MTSSIVSTEWLEKHLQDDAIRILDASWHMPAENRSPQADYEAEHIPGAQFFDIDAISDPVSDLPHMLPSEQQFAEAVSKLGIANKHHVIVYDTKGIFSAPRVWWTFRTFGHKAVSVLDGGLPKWKAENRPLLKGPEKTAPQNYNAKKNVLLVKSREEVASISKSGEADIVDARAGARFRGEVPEPRAGLRSGHIPGSCNLPFGEVLMPPYQTLRTAPELRQLFETAGLNLEKPVIATCGSGLTACILVLALHQIGKSDVSVYDGSWSEWGRS